MSVNLGIWDKLSKLVVFLILIASLFAVLLWYAPVIKKNERMRKQKLEMDQQMEKEVEISKRLDASTKAMQDPRTVERLARERLGYARPGETVIHFETPVTNTPIVRP
jgi:cell division protein FtsB